MTTHSNDWIPADERTPEPLDDVLAMRADTLDGTPFPDICFFGTDGRWYSACEGGEQIPAPDAWLPIPHMPPQPRRLD